MEGTWWSMRTFAQRKNRLQKPVSSTFLRQNRATIGSDHREHPIHHLQRTIGNQALVRLAQLHADERLVGLTVATSPRFEDDFGQIPNNPPAAGAIQTTLAINKERDQNEQEAGRISGQVTRTAEPQLQNTCPSSEACLKRQTEQPAQEQERLQAQQVGPGDLEQTVVPPVVDEVLSEYGQPLNTPARAFMESRFGYDFRQVRVHTDKKAAASTKAMGALAYTYGSDVVFGAGQYSPHTYEGGRLLAHELAHVVQQRSFIPQNHISTKAEAQPDRAGCAGTIQLKRDDKVKVTQPTLIKIQPGITDRIEDAYGAGSLDQTRWSQLVDSAERASEGRRIEEATHAYLSLYSDVANLAQATRVVRSSDHINLVTGNQHDCKDAKPGLNFSFLTSSQWGALGTTGFVNEQGKLGVELRGRGELQPEVAIVLCRSAFKREKEQTLAVLRHEMVHAEHDMEDAAAALLSNPAARSGPIRTTTAKSELLAHVEGFMTMFHLAHPAPISIEHPAFQELLGALDTGKITPWAQTDPSSRSEALGRLQEYYCHALDELHREAFDAWVLTVLTTVRTDEVITAQSSSYTPAPGSFDEKAVLPSEGDVMGAAARVKTLEGDFFRGLQRVIASKCKGLKPSLQLP